MPRKIDVELTSAQPDGSFNWRAAGARQPKGVVGSGLLYPGAKVGDVVRAEATFDIEGVVITSVVPPPHARVEKAARIEIVGTRKDEPGVTSHLAPKGRDRDGDRGGRPERGGPGGRPDRARTDRSGGRPDSGRPERTGRTDRSTRPDGARPERASRPDSGRTDRGPRADRGARPGARSDGDQKAETPGRPRPKRLSPGSAHRDAVLDALSPEQRVIAEQLFRGGIPAVRAAVKTQNEARAEGTPSISAEPLMVLAEELLPSVREAEWRDRAEAAKAIIDEVGLRDLRAVVTASEAAARGEDARALAAELREALDRRLTAQRDEWVAEITTCLGDGRLVRALRLSSRPPDPTTKLTPELLEQLSGAAGEAMAPDAPGDRWGTLLEAVLASPVRRTVKPAGLPAQASPALVSQAKQAVGRVPALSAMLGVDMPPPPGRRPVPAPPRPSPVEPSTSGAGDTAPAAAQEEPVGAVPEGAAIELPQAEVPGAEVVESTTDAGASDEADVTAG